MTTENATTIVSSIILGMLILFSLLDDVYVRKGLNRIEEQASHLEEMKKKLELHERQVNCYLSGKKWEWNIEISSFVCLNK